MTTSLPTVSISPPRRLGRWLRSVLFYEHWMIGLIDQPIRNAIQWKVLPPVQWVARFDPRYYLADPFPWPGSGDTLLCEKYDTKTQQGHIAALKIGAKGIEVDVAVDFPLPGHLSFPFLLLHQGVVYALPESCAARRLELFRWIEQSGVWTSHAVIFTDRAVADAALFEKDGWFWISYIDVDDDPHDNLHLLYARDLAGPWQPHVGNPVRRGKESSRNGGAVFEVDGRLYRPAQDCSSVYGGALRIMEITCCTPTEYSEREVVRLKPSSRLYPDGVHTLTMWGDQCLVDGMRLVFSWRLLWRKMMRRLRIAG